uniref:C2 domain-containing protein n=1 Tax=Rhabditophanes sp. KR3021 TaxID=114890 RepID=A0AC35TYP1_9BILA
MTDQNLRTLENLEFRIACINLPTEAYTGCRVSAAVAAYNTDYVTAFYSENVSEQLHPGFEEVGKIKYKFELKQKLKLQIFAVDLETNHDKYLIGESVITIQDLLAHGEGHITLNRDPQKVVNNQAPTVIHITIEKVNVEIASMIRFEGSGLCFLSNDPKHPSKSLQTNPYFIFKVVDKMNAMNNHMLYKSEHVKNSSKPHWKAFFVITKYMSLFTDSMLQIIVMNYNPNEVDSIIGTCSTTFNDLLNGQALCFYLNRANGSKMHDMKVDVVEFRGFELPSFTKIISSKKLRLHTTIGIDFSAYNGIKTDKGCCHYINNGSLNEYQNVMKKTFDCISENDLNRKVFAFGANLYPKGVRGSTIELLTNETANLKYFTDVGALNRSYSKFVMSHNFGHQNDLSEVILQVKSMAKANETANPGTVYFILVIYTNGCIRNGTSTINALVEASEWPVSVVIIPVQNSTHPFCDKYLEEFDKLTWSHNKHQDNTPLRREVLTIVNPLAANTDNVSELMFRHIPRQVEEWFHNSQRLTH